MSVTTIRLVDDNRVGTLLREWRSRRRLSQLDLALEAGISTRHLSFVETGRSKPSLESVMREWSIASMSAPRRQYGCVGLAFPR